MIQIHYTREYFGRLIFIAELDGEPFIGYRSSGLAGHGSKGVVLPTWLLKTEDKPYIADQWNGMVVGWLPKLYILNDDAIPYFSKNLSTFPEPLRGHLVELTEQLATIEAPCDPQLDVQEYAKLINKEMLEIVTVVETDHSIKLEWRK